MRVAARRPDESCDYLRDSVRRGWWEPPKYIPLGRWSTLSLGGDLRVRYERLDHPGFGAFPSDPGGYALERVMLHGHRHVGRPLRVFVQVASALEQGRAGGPRPIDIDSLRVRSSPSH